MRVMTEVVIALCVQPVRYALALTVLLWVIVNGAEYNAELGVGSEPLVVYLISAPGVGQLIETVWPVIERYVPVTGDMCGVATVRV